MSRYVSMRRSRSYWFDEDDGVHEVAGVPQVSDHGPVDTGLLDSAGDPIMRLPNPLGFGRDNEW